MEKGIQKIMNNQKERLLEQLKDKKYREAFVSEIIDTGIPFQIRALRKQRKLSQKEMSEKIGMKQERISVLEDPNYGKLTLSTLKKIASSLDIGLLVKFVPISDLVKWELNISSESLKALSYDDDPYFKIKVSKTNNMETTEECATVSNPGTTSNVIYISDVLADKTNIPSNQNVTAMRA